MCAASLLSGGAWQQPGSLFFSLLGTYVPADEPPPAPAADDAKRNNPLYWLFQDNQQAIPPSSLQGLENTTAYGYVPVYRGSHSELVAELFARRRSELPLAEVDVLLYAHESVEADDRVLPALKIRNQLGLRRCLPMSLGYQGSLASVTACEVAAAFIRAESRSNVLLVTADSIVPPFSRQLAGGYPKGDSAAAALISTQPGDYQVEGYQLIPHCSKQPYHRWDDLDYQNTEQQLLQLTDRMMDGLHGWLGPPDWLVVQSVSPAFDAVVAEIAARYGSKLMQREKARRVNLLGSDPFVTLDQSEQQKALRAGQLVLLLWASWDHGVGGLLLRRMH